MPPLRLPIVKPLGHGVDRALVQTPELSITKIRLWSFHDRSFSLLDGQVKPDLSSYRDNAHIMAAYAELKSRLGTDQIIWCHTRKEDFRETSRQMFEWALHVPIQDVLAFYDTVVWAQIIQKAPCTLPAEQRRQIRNEALNHFPNDPQKRRELEDARTAEIWNQPAPHGGWWTKLFIACPDRDGIDALIPHPIDDSWLLRKSPRGFG